MNHGSSVDGDERGWYGSYTSHYPFHILGGCGRFPGHFAASRPFHEIVHGDKRGYWSGDYGRGVFRSEDTSHSFFINNA